MQSNSISNPNGARAAVAAGLVFLTEKQLAERWQISVKKLQADRWNGRGVTYVKFDRSVRYRLAEVLAYEELRMCVTRNTLQ